MKNAELRKQISIFLPLSEWRVLREAAARESIPITELCRRWIRPGIEELVAKRGTEANRQPTPANVQRPCERDYVSPPKG